MSTIVEGTQVQRLVERLRRVPDAYREFTEPSSRALRFHGIQPVLFEQLMDLGLPHVVDGGEILLDWLDLKNVALGLSLKSPQLIMLRKLGAALARGEAEADVRRTLEIRLGCGEGHDGGCAVALSPPVRAAVGTAAVTVLSQQQLRTEVSLPAGRRYVAFTPQMRRLVAEVTQLEFHHIPTVLAADLGFLRETGLSDCRLATRFLVERGRDLGVPVRAAGGLFLAQPFPLAHAWVEWLADGQWVGVDPFFLTVLARWRVIDADVWPAHRVPMGVLWNLAPGAVPDPSGFTVSADGTGVAPFADDHGRPVPPSFIVG